jgi:PRC-barrel domain
MRKLMLITASTVALAIAGAGGASAQDKSGAARPLTPGSPGAGAIQKDDAMKNDPAMERRRVTVPLPDKSRAADAAAYRSYKDHKEAFAGAKVASGLSADAFVGADVRNAEGDVIGEVTDLMVGTGGRIDMAVIEVGGFLGIGTKTVALNVNELDRVPARKGFVTAMTKDELKTLSEYRKKGGIWVLSSS